MQRGLARLLCTWGDLGGEDVGVEIDGSGVDEQSLCQLSNFSVKSGHDIWQSFNEGHLTAQGSVHVRELQPDITAANNGNPLGDPLHLQGMIGGEHCSGRSRTRVKYSD